MKIAMIGHKRIPSREGGVEIVVEELASRMVTMGNSVYAYNRFGKNVADENADREAQKLKEYKGIKIIRIPTPNSKKLNAIVYSFFATLHAIIHKYDVIHYHAEGPCAMLIIPHFLGIRTVATIHGLDWQRAKWGGWANRFLKFGEKIAAKYADEVIVLSKNNQRYFLEQYGRKTVYIPNGVNRVEFVEPLIIKEKYGLGKENYILFLARLVPEKGVHYLLEAFSKVDTDMKLVIAGGASHSGEYVKRIQEMAAKDNRVIMTGFVQGNELIELFSNTYMYVLPSDVEGMPISLLEAMSYGRRCLVSNIPENNEAAREFAIYFEKSNIDDLRQKLELAIHTSDMFKKQDEIMDYCCNRFDWDRIAEDTYQLYLNK